MAKMKAIISTKYGSPEVLQMQEVEKPSPKNNELLIKIKASSVTAADSMMRRGTPYIGRLFLGLTKPNHPIPGTGLAGVVEAVGKDVKNYKVGDAIFGESLASLGAYAEYICLPEDGILFEKPDNLSFEEAAGVCDGAVTSINFLKELGQIKKGQKVLIIGASGSLGTAAVQLAKYFGAEVTGVCSHRNIELVKSLGADAAIDYTKTDFTQNGKTYDIIYDTVGKNSFSKCKNSLTSKGIYLSPVLDMGLLFRVLFTSASNGKKAGFSATGALPVPKLRELLNEVKTIIEAGKLKSIVDKRYTLSQVVEAHRYVDGGHKRGNVVLEMAS